MVQEVISSGVRMGFSSFCAWEIMGLFVAWKIHEGT